MYAIPNEIKIRKGMNITYAVMAEAPIKIFFQDKETNKTQDNIDKDMGIL